MGLQIYNGPNVNPNWGDMIAISLDGGNTFRTINKNSIRVVPKFINKTHPVTGGGVEAKIAFHNENGLLEEIDLQKLDTTETSAVTTNPYQDLYSSSTWGDGTQTGVQQALTEINSWI